MARRVSLAQHPRLACLFDAATDAFERTFRSKGPLVPPWRLRQYVGPFGDPAAYARSAALQVDGLRSMGVLTPTTRVLDVGCGTGRIASALTRVLGPGSRYEGVDPQPGPVRWCREHIAREFHQFGFQETGTFSPKYHPGGGSPADQYRLPFSDQTFDLVILLSVLTHVARPTEETLVRECARVLAPNGRIVLTEYLLDEATRASAAAGRTNPAFPYPLGDDRTQTPGTPEGFVARDAPWARGLWARCGVLVEVFHPGSWSADRRSGDPFAERYGFFQDTAVLVRDPSSTVASGPGR